VGSAEPSSPRPPADADRRPWVGAEERGPRADRHLPCGGRRLCGPWASPGTPCRRPGSVTPRRPRAVFSGGRHDATGAWSDAGSKGGSHRSTPDSQKTPPIEPGSDPSFPSNPANACRLGGWPCSVRPDGNVMGRTCARLARRPQPGPRRDPRA
jgi:hypothetical protein